jgi:hypothetical protein
MQNRAFKTTPPHTKRLKKVVIINNLLFMWQMTLFKKDADIQYLILMIMIMMIMITALMMKAPLVIRVTSLGKVKGNN